MNKLRELSRCGEYSVIESSDSVYLSGPHGLILGESKYDAAIKAPTLEIRRALVEGLKFDDMDGETAFNEFHKGKFFHKEIVALDPETIIEKILGPIVNQ